MSGYYARNMLSRLRRTVHLHRVYQSRRPRSVNEVGGTCCCDLIPHFFVFRLVYYSDIAILETIIATVYSVATMARV